MHTEASTVENYAVGDLVSVVHSRKGSFTMRITNMHDPEWISGIIEAGRANAILHYNVVNAGESITIRRSFAEITKIEDPGITDA